MTHRRYALNPTKTPTLTGGQDHPETPCMSNRPVYDELIDRPNGADVRYVIEKARALCATCPIWQACLTANAGEEWAIAVATGRSVQQRAAAGRAS